MREGEGQSATELSQPGHFCCDRFAASAWPIGRERHWRMMPELLDDAAVTLTTKTAEANANTNRRFRLVIFLFVIAI